MDDLCVHSKDRVEHVIHLKLVFEKCKLYRVCLNLEKYVFMRQGKILGHVVSKNGILTDFAKIKVIVELSRPQNARQVQSFMVHCGYYCRFIYMYAVIARPSYAVITRFDWVEECEEAFKMPKEFLIFAPILKSPDGNLIFHVHIDASNFAIRAVLAQPGEKNMDFPISYASR